MSYLARVTACNTYEPAHFRQFVVDGQRVGSIQHRSAELLARWPAVFEVGEREVRLAPALATPEARTAAVAPIVDELLRDGVLAHRYGERYPITAGGLDDAVMVIERGAAALFGARCFGQHLNGFVRRGGELAMWIARRSRRKPEAPGKLDNMVAGGLPIGRDLAANVIKECDEEASIPRELAALAVPAGAIAHCYEAADGLKPEVIYCYDLELPLDFVPRVNDGEVEAFYLWPLDEVARLVRDTDEFKMNCDLVIIDFLIRHGYLSPDEPSYLALLDGLRRGLRPLR